MLTDKQQDVLAYMRKYGAELKCTYTRHGRRVWCWAGNPPCPRPMADGRTINPLTKLHLRHYGNEQWGLW